MGNRHSYRDSSGRYAHNPDDKLDPITRVVALGDTHWDASTPIHWSWVLTRGFLKDIQPDCCIIGGDILDFSYISKWDIEYEELRRGKYFARDFELATDQINFIKENAGKIIYLEGNHDFRMERYIQKHPELRHILELQHSLHLDELEIEFIPYIKKPYKFGKLNFIHGWYCNEYHAAKHLQKFAGNLLYFHVHKFQQHSTILMEQEKPIQAQSIGCLSDVAPEWYKGRPTHWENGLAVIDFDSKGNFQIYPLRFVNRQVIFEKHIWHL